MVEFLGQSDHLAIHGHLEIEDLRLDSLLIDKMISLKYRPLNSNLAYKLHKRV